MKLHTKKNTVGKPLGFDREVVVGSAMSTFWKHGYSGTSIELLERATQISRSSITNTFRNKRGLYDECIIAYQKLISKELIEPLYKNNPDANTRLQGFFQNILKLEMNKNCGTGCLILNTANEFGGQDSAIKSILHSNIIHLEKEFKSVLVRGQVDGSISSAPDDAAELLLSFFITLLTISRSTDDIDVRSRFENLILSTISHWR